MGREEEEVSVDLAAARVQEKEGSVLVIGLKEGK